MARPIGGRKKPTNQVVAILRPTPILKGEEGETRMASMSAHGVAAGVYILLNTFPLV